MFLARFRNRGSRRRFWHVFQNPDGVPSKLPVLANSTKNNNYECKHAQFWATFEALIDQIVKLKRSDVPVQTALISQHLEILENTIPEISNHSLQDMPPTLPGLVVDPSKVRALSSEGLVLIGAEGQQVKDMFLRKKTYEALKSWREYCTLQLRRGGTLFKFVAREMNQFMQANPVDSKGMAIPPEQFLEEELGKWMSLWASGDQSEVAQAFEELFGEVLAAGTKPKRFELTTLDRSLKGYSRHILGADNWGPDELRRLPPILKANLCDDR